MWLIVLLGLIAAVVLFLLFPGARLEDGFKDKPADSTSVHYMQALLENQPNNDNLRVELARNLLEMWLLDEAKQVLKPIAGALSHSIDARLLTTEIKYREFFNDNKIKHKVAKKGQILDDIKQLYPEITHVEKLEILAEWSNKLGKPFIAAKIYQRILKILDESTQAHRQVLTPKKNNQVNLWLILGVQNAHAEDAEKTPEYFALKNLQALLAAKEGQQAMQWATVSIKRFKDSPEILQWAIKIAEFEGDFTQARDWGRLYIQHFSQQKMDLEKQLNLELAANDLEQSVQWIQFLTQEKPVSPLILRFTIALATGLERNKLASKLGRALLVQSPKDLALLEKQVQLDLAVPDLDAAVSDVQLWVKQDPDNIQARLQFAEIAQWAGKPKVSMNQWVNLYDRTGHQEYFNKAIIIGKGQFQHKFVSALFNKLSQTRELTDLELKDWYASILHDNVDEGERHLKAYVNRWKNHKRAWQILADIQALLGKFKTAIKTQKKIESQFKTILNPRLQQSKYFFQLGQIGKAWDLLTQTERFASDKDRKFWAFYGELAWITGNEAVAIKSYRLLLKTGSLQKEMIPRLIVLAEEEQQQEQTNYAELLTTILQQTKEPNYLLDALDLLLNQDKQKEAQLLISLIEQQKINQFKQLSRYWIIKARLARNNKADAKQFLRQALNLNPKSKDVLVSLIWHMVDSEDTDNLKPLLQSISKFSRSAPDVWHVMAAGYRSLGEPLQAIQWYKKAAERNADDYLLQLEYADALEETGQKVIATKHRQNLFHHVRPEIVTQMEKTAVFRVQEFQFRYAQLVMRHIGIDAGEKWLVWLQNQSDERRNAVLEEYRIAWYLAQGRIEQARWWLLKQQYTRLKTPVWQQLAIALADNNTAKIDKILNGDSKLYTLDRIAGLQSIGRQFEALALARKNLNTANNEDQLLVYRKAVSGLGLNNPDGFALAGKFDNVSELEILGVFAEAAKTLNSDSFWLKYNHNHLTTKKNTITLQSEQKNENNIRIKWQHRNPRHQYWLEGGASLRNDQNLYGFKAGYQYQLWNGWSTAINLQFNELSNESAAFRVGGARDQLTLSLHGEISKREYFGLSLHGRHYKTREGSSMGSGITTEFQAGYKIRFENPAISVVLHGMMNQSNLNKTLPNELASIVESDATIENVLSKEYKEIGLDLRIAEGEFDPFGFVDRSLRYYLDTGVFFSDPSDGPGVKVEAGIGCRLFDSDELSLTGRYVDVQGGINTIPTMALQLRYSRRFN